MFIPKPYEINNLTSNLTQLIEEFHEFAQLTDTNIAIYANVANHLKNYFKNQVNWIGFYLVNNENNLDLGPFNGLPAVTKIGNQKGVCGTCLHQRKTQVVHDVCAEPNHIVCDVNSKSEIVIPLWVNNQIVAVLDSDAPTLSFFQPYQTLLESYLTEVCRYLKYEKQNTIYLAGGCFWGVEEYFSRIKGVIETKVGYANSSLKFPSYKDICEGRSDGVEAVKVVYDSDQVSLNSLLESLYEVIDPTSLNKQGGDKGAQYRTGIYSNNDQDFEIGAKSLKELQKKHSLSIQVENLFLTNFYEAEDYHQRYLKKNPGVYCHITFK